MRILNIGSLNLDYFYTVDHMTQKGETQSSDKVEIFAGGKGLNQSIALSNTGLEVYHAGFIGDGGQLLLDTCQQHNINTKFLQKTDVQAGNAIIQVDKNGDNCILLFGGSNQILTIEFVDSVLDEFGAGDYLILQNEVNLLDYIIDKAFERDIKIVLNPSPFDEKISKCDLSKIWLFMLNEVEGEQISGKVEPSEILDFMQKEYPNSQTVLTLGANGSYYAFSGEVVYHDIIKTDVVDTTAAGDTFTGYFVYAMMHNFGISQSLKLATVASSITITKKGAASSIPKIHEVLKKCKHK
ncbi:MAG: ribokinase [Clostridia bacterium]